MDWITGMQQAINEIENSLSEPLDIGAAAKRACISEFWFQRLFGILCGCTVGEYVRRRRLTIAGQELAAGGVKVIDAALRWGYDSPESFSRAFTRFHGISPSQARKAGASLRSFSPLKLKLTLEGGTMLNYRIEERGAFTVIEKVQRFSMKNEENKKGIPVFWTQSQRDGTLQTLCGNFGGAGPEGMLLGICYGSDSDSFDYSIAVPCPAGTTAPEGFRVNTVAAHTWAVFTCRGPMPGAIQQLWHNIYTEFFPTSQYEPLNEIDFEGYPEGDNSKSDYVSEIWIAVKKKA